MSDGDVLAGLPLKEAVEWLMAVHGIYIDVYYQKEGFSSHIRKVRFGEQVGATLILEDCFPTAHEAQARAIDFIKTNVLNHAT